MLEFNGTFIVLAISFVIFVVLENFIFYRPLKKVIDERTAYIKENEALADESSSAAQNLVNEKDGKIAQAKEESSQMIEALNSKEQEKFDLMLKEAKQNSNKSLDEAKTKLEEEKNIAENELKKEIGVYASDIISKILKKEVSVVNLNDEMLEKAMRGEL